MPTDTWTHPRHPLIEARHLVSCSRPCIVGTGAPTFAIAGRHGAGESIFELAGDYDVMEISIEAALRFELDQSAKRAWRKWYREVSR